MSDSFLKILSDLATDAHTRIQKEFADLNPVVGVRRGMRDNGIPADAMTIDCLRTRKRIVMVLHDHHKGLLIYQFTHMDKEQDAPYRQMPFAKLSSDTLYGWIKNHFAS